VLENQPAQAEDAKPAETAPKAKEERFLGARSRVPEGSVAANLLDAFTAGNNEEGEEYRLFTELCCTHSWEVQHARPVYEDAARAAREGK